MSNNDQWRARADAKAALETERAQIQIDKDRAHLELQKSKDSAKQELKTRKHQERLDRDERTRKARAKKRVDRTRRRDQRREYVTRLQTQLRDNVAGAMSGCVYIIALGSAAIGQMQTAQGLGLPTAVGGMFVVFLEGGAVSAALTAHKARMGGERSLMAQTVMIALTAAAVAIQIFGHASRLEGVIMATATITAVVVFEMRLSIAVTARERANGIAAPARFGARRWIVAPISTVRAWRMDVVSRAYGEASAALSAADHKRRTARTARAEARTARRTARTEARTARAYNRAARTAVRTGTPLPLRPIAGTGHLSIDADTRGQNADSSADSADELADTRGQSTDTADSVPMISGQPAWIAPDNVPTEWVDQYGSPARTLSADSADTTADTPDTDLCADSNADTDLSADTHTPDSADTLPGRTGAAIPPNADSSADTRGHSADSARTVRTPGGQCADTADTADTADSPNSERTVTQATADTLADTYQQHINRTGKKPSARALAREAGCGKTAAAKYLKTQRRENDE